MVTLDHIKKSLEELGFDDITTKLAGSLHSPDREAQIRKSQAALKLEKKKIPRDKQPAS